MIDVKLLRITTGEEVVAELLSETEETITVQNGLVVLPTNTGVGFAPWATVISKEEPEITMSKPAAHVQEDQVAPDCAGDLLGAPGRGRIDRAIRA